MVVLTQANWETEVVNSEVPVLVDFWGPGCAPCKQIEPLLHEAERTFGGMFKFGKVNTNTDGPLAMKYGVRSLPTLMLFKDGKMEGQSVGSLGKTALTSFLQKVI